MAYIFFLKNLDEQGSQIRSQRQAQRFIAPEQCVQVVTNGASAFPRKGIDNVVYLGR